MSADRPPDLDAVRESYDAVADNYVAMVGDPGPWLRAALDAFAEQVRDIGPVLDAGCGPGWIAGYLRQRGLDVSGIDLSPRMIEHARRVHPGISFEVASVTDLRPEPGSLGGVLGWWSWFNLPRVWLPEVITRMARALRPGGQLILGMHRGEGDHARVSCYGGVPVRWTTHLYQPDELAGWLGGAGLDVIADLRLPPEPPSRSPRLIMAARRPPADRPRLAGTTDPRACLRRARVSCALAAYAGPVTAEIHLVAGLNGAGKTTWARHLEATLPALRLSLDEWMLRLYGLRFDDPGYPELAARCRDLSWDLAAQAIRAHTSVVLDWNLWSRARRADARSRAADLGVRPHLHHVEVPVEVAIARAAERTDPHAHALDADGIRHLAGLFEPPHASEGFLLHVVGSDTRS